MAYKRKTWKEKLTDSRQFPKTLPFDPKFPCGKALEKMGAKPGDPVVLVPHLEVYEIMKNVPEGNLITLKEICIQLAEKHSAQYCCTLTTGISVMLAANAAEEDKTTGIENTIPYWRTLKMDGSLNDKFPGGAEKHKELLEKEGFKIIRKGKKYFVENFEKYL